MGQALAFEIFKTAIGPFVGAGLAFLSTGIHNFYKQQREDVAAGNVALTTLNSMLNEFLLFRIGTYGDLADPTRRQGSPTWALLRPAVQSFGDHAIELKSLGFLFDDLEALPAIGAVQLANLRYRDMVVMHEFRNEAAVAVYEVVSTKEFTSDQQAEAELGPQRISKMLTAITAVALRARDEEKDYRAAYNLLRAALVKRLTHWWWWKPQFGNLGPVLPHFRQENLPTLPPAVLALLAAHDQQSAAARDVAAAPQLATNTTSTP
jgi:hypothetical protein